MSPLQVCREGLNWAEDRVARLDCLSMTKNPKVRHTHKAWTEGPQAVCDDAEAKEQGKEGKTS